MALFSERYDLVEKTKLQKESLEVGTRNLLWNALYKYKKGKDYQEYYLFVEKIWSTYLKKPNDELPYERYTHHADSSFLKNIFINGSYEKIFDILELAANTYKLSYITVRCNEIFEQENCAYRFIDKYITEITSDTEIQEIEEAVNTSNNNIAIQLKKALEHLSDRQNPDYRNAIKESISAVETLCRNITGESTLDRALNKIENKGVVFNSQLKEGLKNIYTYTNGKNGIRHALMDGTTPPTKADAKFMIVMCSAFINYIRENGING